MKPYKSFDRLLIDWLIDGHFQFSLATVWKMCFTCRFFFMQIKLIFFKKKNNNFCTMTHFQTEAEGNFRIMVYWLIDS